MLDAYKIRWTAKPDQLTIVSIGTGSHRERIIPEQLGLGRTSKLAISALKSLMDDVQTFVLTQMQYLGECPAPWWINSEIEDLSKEKPPGDKMFRFLRYDVRLEGKWIETLREQFGTEKFDQTFGRRLTDIDVIRMRGMDDPTIIKDIYKLSRIAAKQQVKAEHWVGELACWCDGRRPSAQPRQMAFRTSEPSIWGGCGWPSRNE
jgi:hypothetical protein